MNKYNTFLYFFINYSPIKKFYFKKNFFYQYKILGLDFKNIKQNKIDLIRKKDRISKNLTSSVINTNKQEDSFNFFQIS